jgi:hypothetical protein
MNSYSFDNQRRTQICAWVVTITAICAHYTSVLMAQPVQFADKAHWNDLEIHALLDYLVLNRAQGGDGGNFPQETYNKAAVLLNADETLESVGALKTGKKVKTKWTSVICYLDLNLS